MVILPDTSFRKPSLTPAQNAVSTHPLGSCITCTLPFRAATNLYHNSLLICSISLIELGVLVVETMLFVIAITVPEIVVAKLMFIE